MACAFRNGIRGGRWEGWHGVQSQAFGNGEEFRIYRFCPCVPRDLFLVVISWRRPVNRRRKGSRPLRPRPNNVLPKASSLFISTLPGLWNDICCLGTRTFQTTIDLHTDSCVSGLDSPTYGDRHSVLSLSWRQASRPLVSYSSRSLRLH